MNKRWWVSLLLLLTVMFSGCFLGSHLTRTQHLAKGLALYDKQNYKGAKDHLKVAVEAFRDSVMLPRALYLYGESLFHLKDYNLASQQFNRLTYSFPKDSLAELARLKVNACYRQQFYDALKKYYDEDYLDARNDLKVVILSSGLPSILDSARYYYADCYFFTKEYILAISEYERLTKFYPRSLLVDDAQYRIGMCYFKLAPRYSLDQEYTLKAISEFQRFVEEYPRSELRPEVDKQLLELRTRLGRKAFEVGKLYRRMGEFEPAVLSFQTVINDYYDTPYASQALYWKAECLRRLGNLDEARNEFAKFVEKFPQSKYYSKAKNTLSSLSEIPQP